MDVSSLQTDIYIGNSIDIIAETTGETHDTVSYYRNFIDWQVVSSIDYYKGLYRTPTTLVDDGSDKEWYRRLKTTVEEASNKRSLWTTTDPVPHITRTQAGHMMVNRILQGGAEAKRLLWRHGSFI